jgi:ankyrin repeat protein
MSSSDDPRTAFVRASVWHGPLAPAQAILSAHPDIADSDIYTASILGDDVAVARFIAIDPALATSQGPPLGWDALTYLCFSNFLRIDRSRGDAFVRAAKVLLDAGASANTGFWELDHQPEPEWESALYGAAGVAHNAELTRLLLERGADPNDEETPYHTPETYDNGALLALLDSGKLNPDSLSTMLLRKADWHDYDGLRLLLERGADPNRMTRWPNSALHQAVRRDNDLRNVELLLIHGADPLLPNRRDGKSTIAIAADRGRGDILKFLDDRDISTELGGIEDLIAACARNDAWREGSILKEAPGLLPELLARGGTLLAEFAGTGNTEGIRHLLDLGVRVDAPYEEGDGYFGIAKNSTALHVAAWRARHETVRFLIDRGAAIDATDGKGRTPLALAVRACVDSYWAYRRSPESVDALLRAGASVNGVSFPSGYPEVDELLIRHRIDGTR